MRKVLTALLVALAGSSALAAPQTVTLADRDVFPESITALPDGTVITGSMLQPYIYRAKPGAATAERWIDMTSFSSTSLGVLADRKSNRLWACTMAFHLPAKNMPPADQRHSFIRTFDLKTGAPKDVWPISGCNDMSLAPDGTAYISDPGASQIYRLKPGAAAVENWLKTPELAGVDGIAFVGPTLYVSNVQTNKMYRIPVNPDGSGGTPVEIALSQPINGPDGVRAWGGKLYVAENRGGRVSVLTLHGDTATVTVLKDGYQFSTGVAPAGNTVWEGESKALYMRDPALANADPNPFKLYPLPMPK